MKIKREFSRVEWNWNVSFELPIKFNFNHKYERTRCKSEIKRHRNRIVKSHKKNFTVFYPFHRAKTTRTYTHKTQGNMDRSERKEINTWERHAFAGSQFFFLSSVFFPFYTFNVLLFQSFGLHKIQQKESSRIDRLLRNCKYKIYFERERKSCSNIIKDDG